MESQAPWASTEENPPSKRCQFVHKQNCIHRNLNPEDFVMGVGSLANQIYIVDFELEKRYRDGTTHAHIPRVERKPLTGTARYASVRVLKNFEQLRPDHVEVLGYAWIYPLPGNVPWMGCRGRDERQKPPRSASQKTRHYLNL
jgi:serine/threonine protein kinase